MLYGREIKDLKEDGVCGLPPPAHGRRGHLNHCEKEGSASVFLCVRVCVRGCKRVNAVPLEVQ